MNKNKIKIITIILGVLLLFPISVSAKETEYENKGVGIVYSDDGTIDHYTFDGEGEYTYLELKSLLISKGWSFEKLTNIPAEDTGTEEGNSIFFISVMGLLITVCTFIVVVKCS